MRRFFVGPPSLSGERVEIEGALAHRIVNVVRLHAGDEVLLFDGSGSDSRVRLDAVSRARLIGSVIERRPGPAEPRIAVCLYQSITKGERFDWLIEKATEIGVARIAPLLATRAVVKTAAGGSRSERWRRIAIEAAEQCERSVVPEVTQPIDFAEALAEARGLVLLAYEEARAGARTIAAAIAEHRAVLDAAHAISILIGPEGGYERDEVEQAQAAGATVVTLGRRVLRSETAGLVAATLSLAAVGELG